MLLDIKKYILHYVVARLRKSIQTLIAWYIVVVIELINHCVLYKLELLLLLLALTYLYIIGCIVNAVTNV